MLVIGGGPAGVTAALQARELGAEVTLVEAKRVGGTSLNEGPAPLRTLARAARLVRDARSWGRFGLRGDPPEVDVSAALANAGRFAGYAHDQRRLADVIRDQGIELVEGSGPARFVDPHTVRIPDGRRFGGDAVIVAVGGHAGRLPIPGAELALTYQDIRDLTELPATVAVVGGADTGCQLASILADFGARVTVIEASPRLLPHADLDVSTGMAGSFVRRSITVRTSTLVERLERTSSGVAVHYRFGSGPTVLDVDAVFFAVGWPGNADALAADAVGIATARGQVKVGKDLRSSLPHVLAAGDVNGLSMLVPSARHEGQVAAENAVLGTRRQVDHQVVPTGSFTDPEYGSVGLTEAQALERGDYAVAVVRYGDLVRPVLDGHPEGFCKLIVDRDHRHLLGAHVLGEYSAEVIQMVAACMAADMRIEQVAALQLAFPTFTEGVGVAAARLVRELGVTALAAPLSALLPPKGPRSEP
ncbi:dihydrolipoyl dehydrogenase family protein [Actinoplanes ianthinogenes]|uniref:dihydrolipoyl dehydrogenase family protein n=1 Tax=Actinoplanes ianthinogenes TaxID=122358 RepID=UPI00166FD2CA|nr:NAD(P)/FAD-dependent oxidoreductase [Actinoplanes ianthinogenes]